MSFQGDHFEALPSSPGGFHQQVRASAALPCQSRNLDAPSCSFFGSAEKEGKQPASFTAIAVSLMCTHRATVGSPSFKGSGFDYDLNLTVTFPSRFKRCNHFIYNISSINQTITFMYSNLFLLHSTGVIQVSQVTIN